ncbi:MAG: chromosomal replication initiator protein DnaA [Anaerolineae bacterium]
MGSGERNFPSAEQPPTGAVLTVAQKQWQAVLGELQLQMTRATFDTWLRGSEVIAFEEGVFTVYVRHAYAVDWLENRLMPLIRRTLRRRAGQNVDLVFTARTPDQEEHLVLVPETVPEEGTTLGQTSPRTNGRSSEELNPSYTFRSFVVGTSNRLAHAASLAVAENPAHAYNPLFIYGGVGLGKTHLLHALGHEARQRGLTVLYVSSELFTNDLINAIRNQKTEEFRAKYRNNDVLLVDDIQFIAGKERTQEEFFHTFNTLHGAGKQIVVSCDRPPKSLVALEDRLRSRFGWGLIADVQPPDFETRVAILREKAAAVSTLVPNEVLTHIARKVPSNIRELEGALNCVLAHARLMNAPLIMETAEAALESILDRPADLSPQRILSEVARHYGLTEDDLVGRSRRRVVSVPRQLVMYLVREETETSLPRIGELLGGRDHTTILHGCEKIASQIETDEQLRRDWLTIKEKLSEETRR